MKAIFLSDIHSNIYALEAIWDQEGDSDLIYCTGDLVDYGPYPKEVVDWVRDHKVQCTAGNHDRWMIDAFRSGKFLERMPLERRAWINHNASLLSEGDISFLDSLPHSLTFQLDGINYGMAHLYQDYDEITNLYAYIRFRENFFNDRENLEFSRLVLGHTHRQCVHYLRDDVLWMNPGSVSYRRPDDHDQSAHYATITDGIISLKQLSYDLTHLRRKIRGISLMESEIQAAERFFGERTG